MALNSTTLITRKPAPIWANSGPGQAPDFTAKWSPDGRSMVLGRVSRGSETFVIENPLAAVRPTAVSR